MFPLLLSLLTHGKIGPDVTKPRDVQTLLNRVYDAVNEALRISNVYRVVPTRIELQPATTIHAVETQIGDIVEVLGDTLAVGLDYTKGDETKVTIRVYKLFADSGVEYQTGTYGLGIGTTHTFDSFDFSATVKPPPIAMDVSDCAYVKVTEQATLGTPTGTLAVECFVS